MSAVFQSERHEGVYRAVIKRLRGIGYTGGLIQENYEFNDWFLADAPRRQICAAFGQTPFKDRNFDCIRNLPMAETRPEHFDRALADGKVPTNVYPRMIWGPDGKLGYAPVVPTPVKRP